MRQWRAITFLWGMAMLGLLMAVLLLSIYGILRVSPAN